MNSPNKKMEPIGNGQRSQIVLVPWDRSPPPSTTLHPPADRQSPRARSEPDWTSWGWLPPAIPRARRVNRVGTRWQCGRMWSLGFTHAEWTIHDPT